MQSSAHRVAMELPLLLLLLAAQAPLHVTLVAVRGALLFLQCPLLPGALCLLLGLFHVLFVELLPHLRYIVIT